MNIDNKANISTKIHNKTAKLLIGLHIGFLLLCAIFLSLSLSMLSDSKTATGTVTFALTNSPELSMNLYYEESSDIVTYLGISKEQGAMLNGNTDILRVNIKENSTLSITAEFKNASGNNEIQTKDSLSVKVYDETGNNTQTLVKSGESTNEKVIFETTNVNANDYIIIDQIITGIYPITEVKEQDYLITITSQASNSVPATATLSGKYTKHTLKYTVNFYDEDKTTLINTYEVKHGSFVTKPTEPTKEGYIFKGWVTEQGEIFDVETTAITSNLNLYASFEQDIVYYTLSYDPTKEVNSTNSMQIGVQNDAITEIYYYKDDFNTAIQAVGTTNDEGLYEMKIPEGYTVRVYVDESKLQFTYNSYYIGDLLNNYSDMLTKNSSNEIYGEFVVNKDILDFWIRDTRGPI